MKAVLAKLKTIIAALTTGAPPVNAFDHVTIGTDKLLIGNEKFCIIDENMNAENFRYDDQTFLKTLAVDISVCVNIPSSMNETIVNGIIDLCELIKTALLATPNLGLSNVKQVRHVGTAWTSEMFTGNYLYRIRTMTYEIQIIEAL